MILAIDTATPATVVALAGQFGSSERRHDPQTGERPAHTAAVLRFTGELLAEAGQRLGPEDTIAVGVGPGSFTGLRVGIAAARGLAQGSGARLVAISSLRALAQPQIGKPVVAAIDARRGECFVLAFDAAGAPLGSPQAMAPGRFGELPVGLAVGDGALRYAQEFAAAGLTVAQDPEAHRLSASALAAVADGPATDTIEQLLPDYVRSPDAKPKP